MNGHCILHNVTLYYMKIQFCSNECCMVYLVLGDQTFNICCDRRWLNKSSLLGEVTTGQYMGKCFKIILNWNHSTIWVNFAGDALWMILSKMCLLCVDWKSMMATTARHSFIIQYSQRHSVINHCDRRITHFGDLDISFVLLNISSTFLLHLECYLLSPTRLIKINK